MDHKRYPSFHYQFGDLQVEEKPLPQNGETLYRQVRVRSASAHSNLYFFVASGDRITETEMATYRIDNRYTIKVHKLGQLTLSLRDQQGRKELLLHVPLERGNSCLDDWTEFPLVPIPTETIFSTTFDLEYSWKR